jgi:hypothetical protein
VRNAARLSDGVHYKLILSCENISVSLKRIYFYFILAHPQFVIYLTGRNVRFLGANRTEREL